MIETPRQPDPAADFLTRRYRITVALTVIPALIGSMILAIFQGFGRPDVGLVVVGLLFLPVVVVAWWDFLRLRQKVRASLRDQRPGETEKAPPG